MANRVIMFLLCSFFLSRAALSGPLSKEILSEFSRSVADEVYSDIAAQTKVFKAAHPRGSVDELVRTLTNAIVRAEPGRFTMDGSLFFTGLGTSLSPNVQDADRVRTIVKEVLSEELNKISPSVIKVYEISFDSHLGVSRVTAPMDFHRTMLRISQRIAKSTVAILVRNTAMPQLARFTTATAAVERIVGKLVTTSKKQRSIGLGVAVLAAVGLAGEGNAAPIGDQDPAVFSDFTDKKNDSSLFGELGLQRAGIAR